MECQPSICQKPCQKLENSGKLGETGRNLARNWMKHLNLACSSPFSQITGLFENLQIYWEKIVLWSFLGPWSLFAKFQIFGTWSLFQNRDLLFFPRMSSLTGKQPHQFSNKKVIHIFSSSFSPILSSPLTGVKIRHKFLAETETIFC